MTQFHISLPPAGEDVRENPPHSERQSLDHWMDDDDAIRRKRHHANSTNINGTNDEDEFFANPTVDEDEDEDDNDDLVASSMPTNKSSSSWSRNNIPSLTCAFLSSLTTGGTTYAFSIYSTELKRSLNLKQPELDTISSAFFCAGVLSFLPGWCADRYGPRRALAFGGVLGSLSLMTYWTVARQFIPLPSHSWIVPTLSILGIITFMSNAAVTGSVFKIIVGCTGPGNRGSAVGAAKGYVGLGAGAYGCLFESLKGVGFMGFHSDLDFLPMAAFFAIVAATIPALCLLDAKKGKNGKGRAEGGTNIEEDDNDEMKDVATPWHFTVVYAGLLGLGLVVVGTSVLELYEDSSGSSKKGGVNGDNLIGGGGSVWGYVMAGAIVSVWLGPILAMLVMPTRGDDDDDEHDLDEEEQLLPTMTAVPLEEAGMGTKGLDSGDTDKTDRSSDASLECGGTGGAKDEVELSHLISHRSNEDEHHEKGNGEPLDQSRARTRTSGCGIGEGKDLNLTEMLRTLPAWLLLWTATMLTGGGTVMTNNLGQMAEALRFPEVTAAACLSLFSAAQALARVATGALSESALYWKCRCLGQNGIPRPAFMVAASFAGCASHAILSLATSEVLFIIGVTFSGLAFGMVWPLMVLLVGECFGRKHVGANYMFYDGTTSAVGTLLLSKFAAQEVYEKHIVDGGSDGNGGEDTCFGTGCFRMTHMIVVALSLTCISTSAAFWHTTRNVYMNYGKE